MVNGAAGLIAGRLGDKLGARWVITCGSVILGLGFILMSRMGNLWQLYLFYGVLIGLGASTMNVPIISLITRWFPEKPGLMAGIGISGVGFGIGVIPAIANRLLILHNWRKSILIIGLASMILLILLSRFLRKPGPYAIPKTGRTPLQNQSAGYSLRETVHSRQFWAFCFVLACYGFYYQIGLVHIVPYATDIGVTASAAANILITIGIIGTGARIGLGFVGDRLGIRKTFIISFAVLAVAFLVLAMIAEIPVLYSFGILFGLFCGIGVLISPLSAAYFGLRELGSVTGAITLFNAWGGAAGPLVAGGIFDITGNYRLAFLLCSLLAVAGCLIFLFLKPPVGKTGS